MGTVVLVGGGLHRDNSAVYEAIGQHCGPRIGVFGTASTNPAASLEYNQAAFESHGLGVVPIPITQENAIQTTHDPKILEQLRSCSGFYFAGGDQRRLARALLGTPVLQVIQGRFAEGAGVSGTSAGTAVMTNPMISGGRSLDSWLEQGQSLTFEAGFGFLTNLQVDQHFLAWGRFGRLWKALELQDLPLGVGVDENTALVIPPDQPWQVLGVSQVVLLERSAGGSLISLLSAGDRYDPHSQTIYIEASRQPIAQPDPEIGPIFCGDVFAGRALQLVLRQLVESAETQAIGLAFVGSAQSSFEGSGVRLRLYKTSETRGYLGSSIVRVGMTIAPIAVSVRS